MHVQQVSVQGEDFIGLLGMASDKYAVCARNFPEIEVLDVPVVKTRIYGTNLVGLFCAGNSQGLILPYFIPAEAVAALKKSLREAGVDLNITLLEDKNTALGNLISCNDRGVIASPLVSDIKGLEDALGVEVVQAQVGGHDEVGACCLATNKGFICHPDAEEETSQIAEVLKVKGLPGSVNFGFHFIKSGLIANSNGYVAGSRTSGIELGRIDEALGFID